MTAQCSTAQHTQGMWHPAYLPACVSAAGVCYRLFPSRMWARLAPQQPPEVLRVPLQQLCLSTKAALRAALPDGACVCSDCCTLVLFTARARLVD